jgi:NADPH:quinone reductase-like Zn-dependent oxidoreductase
VLVYGASGTSGTLAVQLARHAGARVTGACSPEHLELVRALGATHVIDYTKPDAADSLATYDLIFDAVGKAKTSRLKLASRRALRPAGRYVSVDDRSLQLRTDRLDALRALCESGAVRPVLDRIFPLAELSAAHAYVAQGHKLGGVAVSVWHA